MSVYTSQHHIDEVERRIAPIATKRLGHALYRQRCQAGAGTAAVPGVDERTLHDFESGHRRPDLTMVIAMLDVYGCSL